MSDSWQKILADAKKGKISSSYLIYGDEEFRVESALRSLVDEIVPIDDRSLNLVTLRGEEVGWDDVLGHLRTTSMFGGRKVVVVTNARLGASPQDAFNKAATAWAEGSEGKKRRAANIVMGILGDLDWPLDALSDSGPDSRSPEEWQSAAKIKLKESDFDWMGGLLDYAREKDLFPRKNEDAEKLEEFIYSADASETVLILTARSAMKSTGICKAIQKNGVMVAFESGRSDSQKRSSLKNELDRVLARSGKKMAPDALALIERKTGFDLRRAVGEIEKVILFVGDSNVIRAQDVESVVPQTREESIFDLTDALAARDLSKSLRLIYDLEGSGHHPLELLGIVHTQIRNLLLATHYASELQERGLWKKGMYYGEFQKRAWTALKESSKKQGKSGAKGRKKKDEKLEEMVAEPDPVFTGLHPFVAFSALRFQSNFKPAELVRALRIMSSVDERVKRSAGDPLTLLEQALVAICKNSPTFLEK